MEKLFKFQYRISYFQYCDFYESSGFSSVRIAESDQKNFLSLDFRKIARITSVKKPKESYQVNILPCL